MSLSDTRIRALKPRSHRYEVADAGGLFVEVQPSGAKVWRYRYRLHGKREKVTIGTYPAIPIADQRTNGKVTIKGARSYHADYKALVAAGKSPARERQAVKARGSEDEATVAGFAPRFVADVLSLQKRPDTNRRRLNRHLLPTLGNRQLGEVDAGQLLAILDALKAKARVQEARHVLILARSFFAYAIARQKISHNPASDIPMKIIGAPGQRDRALDPDEIGKLLAAIERATFLHPVHALAIRLLLLTLCRKGELLAAKWEHVDLDKAEWHVPASNQKSSIPHLVPLSSQAVALFKELKGHSGGSPYVLASLDGRREEPMSDTTLNWALWQITRPRGKKEEALLTIPHFTLHDFRRSGSTLLHASGYVSDVIEKALGHTIKGVRGVYNKATYAPERRTMLQFWANYLDGLTQGKVVPLRQRHGRRA
jgi:integrase